MNLQLSKPLIIFDLETTGINISKDRIVEIYLIKVHPDGKKETMHHFLNPEQKIPEEVIKIHGITDEMVADKPTFKEVVHEIKQFILDCDFGGFNAHKFDFPLLFEEFYRAGVELDTSKPRFVDAQRIFHQMEPRNLSAAYRFYCDKNLDNAHSAAADTEATWEIIQAQIERYDSLKNNMDYLDKLSRYSSHVDFAGRFKYNAQEEIVFNFGKHKNTPVKTVLEKEPSYYDWMMKGDFPNNTKMVLNKIRLEMFGN
jgi:DNA polymerase-3 subunit epsilon